MVFQQEARKGPWTEQEDLKLVSFVGLFGDRRWDFIAKVSGLNRTGKSCRLRWVNYLHPGLKRGKMTPPEERLVLELQSKWGNRWSRIARRLPGRTDNEIKNYWRTHMRKKAQEHKKKGAVPSPPSSPSSDHSSNNHAVVLNSHAASKEAGEESFYDTGGPNNSTQVVIKVGGEGDHEGGDKQEFSMDDIWRDIDLSEENSTLQLVYDGHSTEEGCNSNFPSCPPPMLHSPSSWEYSSSDSLWVMGEESMLFPMSDPYSFSSYAQASAFLTG